MKKPTAAELVTFFSFLILAASLGFVLYLWVSTLDQAERTVGELSVDAHEAALRVVRDNARVLLHRFNASASNIARVLGTGALDQQVSRPLLLAYAALRPMVTHVSFFQEDGLLLSYYEEGNGTTRLVFSNSTAHPNATIASPCYYSQAVDKDTGAALVGGATLFCTNATTRPVDTSSNGGGYTSFGQGWGGAEEPLLLFTAPVKVAALDGRTATAALSLGVPVLALVDSLDDGRPPNAHILLDNSTVSILVDIPNIGKFSKEDLSMLPCKTNGGSTGAMLLDVGGQSFQIYCSSLDYAGMRLVFVRAFPYASLIDHVHKFSTIGCFMVLSIICIVMIASVLIFQWIRKCQRRETLLCSSLIKQKEATQQAERKSMNKSLAFASASHDVRTSLAGITGLIELCRAEVSPQSELDKNLEQMNVCASKLLEILNSVLDISKVEAGKMQLEELEFDISKVIEESVDIFHIVALKKGLEVIWDPCDNSVLNSSKVKGDFRRLKQIIDNLLSNAIKFTFDGHVLVRVWAKRVNYEAFTDSLNYACNFSSMPGLLSCFSYMRDDVFGESSSLYSTGYDPSFTEFIFEVEDTGIGIPKDKRESVFENYVQVKESVSGGQGGTGLGLGIVQSYVRLMGGEINILDKDSDEKGTCFRFNIFLKSTETPNEKVDVVCHGDEVSNELSISSSPISSFQCGHPKTIPLNNRDVIMCKGLKLDSTHVMLLIQGDQTRRIIERWLENLGVKVWVIDQWDLLIPTFERIQEKLSLSHFSSFEKSHAVVSGSHSNVLTVPYDNEREIEESIRIKDGLDCLLPPNMSSHELQKKTSFTNKSTHFLIMLDMSFGSIRDAYFAINGFRKHINYDQYKVVWLANSNTPTTELRSLRNKEVPCDLILYKPLHGSRLFAILKLLQEFGEPIEVIPKINTDDTLQEKDRSNVNYNVDKPLHGMKILVVEDNVVLRRLTSTTLSGLGAVVELSENGKDALELVRMFLQRKIVANDENLETQMQQEIPRHFPYDIILMDCEMPIMNGYEATKLIREEEKQYGLHIPIIALTAHAMAEQEIYFTEAGMDLHLMKPLKADALLDAIHKIKKN